MAQQPIAQDIVVEDVLKAMTLVEGAVQYLVLNSQGIPIKKSPTITAERALHLSFLLMDYWSTTKKVIQSDLKMSDVPLNTIQEHRGEDKNQNYQAKIDYHNPVIQRRSHSIYGSKLLTEKRVSARVKEISIEIMIVFQKQITYSIIFNILTLLQYPRRLNSKHMDKQYSRVSKIYYEQNPYRSTSDLIPKCRSQALKAKRAAAKTKINQIARQLYELKYDHEWQQEQLRRLVNKGECIMREVDLKIKKVQQEVSHLTFSNQPIMEELQMQKIQIKEESFIASDRSTQPEVQSDSISHKRTSSMLFSERLPSKKGELKNNGILKSAVFSNQKMLVSSQDKKLTALKASGSKQISIKSSLRQMPLLNILTFVSLVLVVLFLL